VRRSFQRKGYTRPQPQARAAREDARDDWRVVPDAITIGRRAFWPIKQNPWFTSGDDIVGIALAAFGWLPPIAAAQSPGSGWNRGPRRPCYTKRAMNRWRAVVAVIAVAVWALSAPLAVASNNCIAMGAMCEGPCGVSSCATSNVLVSNILLAVASVSPRPPEGFPCSLLALPDPPPRATLLSA